MKEPLVLEDNKLIAAINEWMEQADGEELCRIAKTAFGGECETEDGFWYRVYPKKHQGLVSRFRVRNEPDDFEPGKGQGAY